ncbi:hypothetical protein QJS66_17090 [Kocuria rhizophila]|nr:hypothetical protein QJS66_17090 [Kocuria rhizophila]
MWVDVKVPGKHEPVPPAGGRAAGAGLPGPGHRHAAPAPIAPARDRTGLRENRASATPRNDDAAGYSRGDLRLVPRRASRWRAVSAGRLHRGPQRQTCARSVSARPPAAPAGPGG